MHKQMLNHTHRISSLFVGIKSMTSMSGPMYEPIYESYVIVIIRITTIINTRKT